MRFSRCSKIVSSSLFRFPGPVSIVGRNDPDSLELGRSATSQSTVKDTEIRLQDHQIQLHKEKKGE